MTENDGIDEIDLPGDPYKELENEYSGVESNTPKFFALSDQAAFYTELGNTDNPDFSESKRRIAESAVAGIQGKMREREDGPEGKIYLTERERLEEKIRRFLFPYEEERMVSTGVIPARIAMQVNYSTGAQLELLRRKIIRKGAQPAAPTTGTE